MQAGVATKTVVRSGGGFCCVSFGLLLEQVPCLFKTMFCSFCFSEKKLILDLSNLFFFSNSLSPQSACKPNNTSVKQFRLFERRTQTRGKKRQLYETAFSSQRLNE